jgi:hypothetical protein
MKPGCATSGARLHTSGLKMHAPSPQLPLSTHAVRSSWYRILAIFKLALQVEAGTMFMASFNVKRRKIWSTKTITGVAWFSHCIRILHTCPTAIRICNDFLEVMLDFYNAIKMNLM